MAKTPDIKEPEVVMEKKTCGIIMPIAPHPDYPTEHWKDVLAILNEAISGTEFEPKLVSDDVAIGLIHDRIVTNIYNNEIVVCDVSSKNPNVMFELGLRLAFDKPTIIIKDETTGYSFDTGIIEHIGYPSSLRFSQIVKFKEELIRRINATYKKSESEANYSPFLKSFGKTITPAAFEQSKISEGKYILEQLEVMRREFQKMRFEQRNNSDHKMFSPEYIKNGVERATEIQNIITRTFDEIKKSNPANDALYENEKLLMIIRNELNSRGFDVSNYEIRNALRDFQVKASVRTAF